MKNVCILSAIFMCFIFYIFQKGIGLPDGFRIKMVQGKNKNKRILLDSNY